MPLTALSTATSPNVAYTRLLYTVSGSEQATNPQFQYVCDVYNRDTNELLKRMTQPINPAGTATFDVARIVQGELKPDYNWKINTPTEFSSSKQGFEVKLGQQYATSISSSVTVYPNLATYQIYCNQGVIEPNAGAYNFQQVVTSNTLSNMPTTMSMQSDDYGTISAYVTSGTTVISQSFYSASYDGDKLVDTKYYSLTSGFDDYFWAVPISSSANYWNYVDVSISGSYDLKTFRYQVSNETHREKVRFAFVNKLGAWDYYNNYNPVRQTMDVSREQYTAPRVDYSSRVSNYDITRRGRTDYHNNTDDSFTTQTDYLNQTDANWLEELIESPSVYIQRNGEFIPIIITDSSYTANTNENRQKLFQYTINFKPANQPFGTWIPEYVECPKTQSTDPDVITNDFTNVEQFSFTLNGEVTSDDGSPIVERGFVYSTSSAVPDVTDTKVTVAGTIGTYSADVTGASQSTLYYARAYASNSIGIEYGGVKTATTLEYLFDPTLGSTIEPYYWYDLTDTSKMILSGSTGDIYAIQSKGSNTGYVAKGSASAVTGDFSDRRGYNDTYWQAPYTQSGYVFFNDPAGWNTPGFPGDMKNSALARLYDSASFTHNFFSLTGSGGVTDDIGITGKPFTYIGIQRIFWDYNNLYGINFQFNHVSFSPFSYPNGSGLSRIYPLTFTGATTLQSNAAQDVYFSTSTGSASGDSGSLSVPWLSGIGITNAAYSYLGTTGSWESRYIKYDGSTNWKVGREPNSNQSASFNTAPNTATGFDSADGFTIGGSSINDSQGSDNWYTYPWYGAHVLVYSQSLSDEQIQNVINSYTQSILNRPDLTINSFEN